MRTDWPTRDAAEHFVELAAELHVEPRRIASTWRGALRSVPHDKRAGDDAAAALDWARYGLLIARHSGVRERPTGLALRAVLNVLRDIGAAMLRAGAEDRALWLEQARAKGIDDA